MPRVYTKTGTHEKTYNICPEKKLWAQVLEQLASDVFLSVEDIMSLRERFGCVYYAYKEELDRLMRQVKDPWMEQICSEFVGFSHGRFVAAMHHVARATIGVNYVGESEWGSRPKFKQRVDT